MRDAAERVHWGDTPLLLLDPLAPPDALKWRLEFTGPQTLRVTALTDDREHEFANALNLERWGGLVVVEAGARSDRIGSAILEQLEAGGPAFRFLEPLLERGRALRQMGYHPTDGPPWLVHTDTVAPMLRAIGQSELVGCPGACTVLGVKLAWAPDLDRYVRRA